MAPKGEKIKMGTEPHPFLLSVEEVVQQMGTNLESGLSSTQVKELQSKYPLNELEGQGGVEWYRILIKQLLNAMILVSHFKMRTTSDQAKLTMRIGPCLCHGSQFRCARLHRRSSFGCSYCLERHYWICPRIQGREEDGLFESPFFSQCCCIERWKGRRYFKVSFQVLLSDM